MEKRRAIIVFTILMLALANCFVWFFVYIESPHGLTVAFLNIGQGDAIFIESPTGNQVLIDGGSGNDAVLRELGKVMPIYDRFIDVVIATHPDADHIGGLNDVLTRFHVGLFLESGAQSTTQTFLKEQKILGDEKIPHLRAKRGMKLNLGDGATLSVLYPGENIPPNTPTNDASVIALLSYKDETFLFTGDASQKVEGQLVATYGKNLDVDILKVGHHGSKNSSSAPFLKATSPAYSIISVGAKNRYGHPAPEALARLRQASTTILRTDQLGTIIFQINGLKHRLFFR